MRLIIHGQQSFGQAVLEAILDKGVDEVVAVYCAPDKEGRPLDPLKEFALERGLPVQQPESYKDAKVWDQLASYQADLCVMAYVLLLVPEEALNVPKYGSIQYHPSLLPWHKGPSSINWPIIMGKHKTGLTIFWPDNGLDTGPILLHKEVDIGPDDTLGSIYFDSLVPMGPSGRSHPGTGCREPESTVLDETGLPRPCSSTALVCAASATSSHAARWRTASRVAANARGARAVYRMDWTDAWEVAERPDTSPEARSCCRGGATGSPDRARRRPPRP